MIRLKLEAQIDESRGDLGQSRDVYQKIRDKAATEGLRFFADDQIARLKPSP